MLPIPPLPEIFGLNLYCQGALTDPNGSGGLSVPAEIKIALF